MNKILSIDYGLKRTGLAYAEEPLNIALSLITINTNEIFNYLDNYFKSNKVTKIIIGEPKSLGGGSTDSSKLIYSFQEKISKKYLKSAHKIYNYYITNSYSNFEENELTFKEFYNNYENIISKKLPYLVALYDKKLVGIAYLNNFRDL